MSREHPASGLLNAGRMMYVGRVPRDQPITPGEKHRGADARPRRPLGYPTEEETGEVTASRQWPTYAKGRTTSCSRGTGAAGKLWGVARAGKSSRASSELS